MKANPDAFQGRYPKLQEWLKSHPGYLKAWRSRRDRQDKRPPKRPLQILRLAVPVDLVSDIQDEIRLVRQCGCGVYVAGPGSLSG